jgi:transcriptional regulator with XRE-family HTH domain
VVVGQLLRDLRDSAGLSLKEAGDHLIRDPSTMSRMETGPALARLLEVRELMNLYGVDDPDLRAALESLSRDIWIKGWWDGYARNVQVHVIDLAWMESRSEKLRTFSLPVIQGLLQTRDYAEAVMRGVDPDAPDNKIAEWLEFRMKRQQVLDRLDYTTIPDETLWQKIEVHCASYPISLDEYVSMIGDVKRVVDMLVSRTQRIQEYPKLGFAIEQEMLLDVDRAFRRLAASGFTSRLLG